MKNFFLIIFVILHIQLLAHGLEPVKLDTNDSYISLDNYSETLEDKQNSLKIDDVSSLKYEQLFKKTSETGTNFGFSQSAYWVRFSLKNPQSIKESLYLEVPYPLLDNVTLYIPNEKGNFYQKASGESIAGNLKEINYRDPLFLLEKHNELKTYYVYIKNYSSIRTPLVIVKSNSLIESIDKHSFLIGCYYGYMTLLMFITFVAFFKIRDKIFLTYSFYILTYILFQASMNGFLVQHLSYSSPIYANQITAFLVGFVIFSAALFSAHFLQVWRSKHYKIKLLFYLTMTGALAGSFISLVLKNPIGIQVSALFGMFLPIVILIAAIHALFLGYKPAKYFLIAWGIFLFGIFISGLLYLGLLENNFFTVYSIQIGSVLEVILLSYALIDRFNNLKSEKEKAVLKANQLQNQINEGLQSLVEERTKELKEKNRLLEELSVQDTMTGLLNHNSIIEKLNFMEQTALRYNYNLAVIMLDIDLFKSINDTYGHQIGDEVIIKISNVIKNTLRPSDAAGRYGGEEFIVIMHEATLDDAKHLAERIRLDILTISIDDVKDFQTSASFGISMFHSHSAKCDIIQEADLALYDAKSKGRNCISIHQKK